MTILIILIMILYIICMILCTVAQILYMDIDENMGAFILGVSSIFWPVLAFLSVMAYIYRKIVKKEKKNEEK